MRRQFRKRACRSEEYTEDGRHRFEHWYRDNTVYFITAKCRDHFPAFASEEAKRIFWDRFDHWTAYFGYVPWITSLMRNHYHTLGYLEVAAVPARLSLYAAPERPTRTGPRLAPVPAYARQD